MDDWSALGRSGRCGWSTCIATGCGSTRPRRRCMSGRLYPEVPGGSGRLDGYLLGTSLAVLVCARKPEDWSGQPDAWGSLGLMIARYEAEFAGRIIRDAGDVARWRSSPPDGLCWGVLGVAGFDFLVREADDLDRLPALFERGVRVFQPVAGECGRPRRVGGAGRRSRADRPGPGLPGAARRAGGGRRRGPRPILDLAGMNAATMADTLRLARRGAGSRGGAAPRRRATGRPAIGTLLDDSSPDARNLRELRSRGGVIGLTPGLPGCETPEELKRLIERSPESLRGPIRVTRGSPSAATCWAWIGPCAGLESAREIARWLGQARSIARPPRRSRPAMRGGSSCDRPGRSGSRRSLPEHAPLWWRSTRCRDRLPKWQIVRAMAASHRQTESVRGRRGA